MNKGSEHKSRGFTILETLIVLAVTGTLFFSAVALINGRQNKTQFQTAINNLQQQIQQIINETQSGYYGDNSSYNCSSSGGLRPTLTLSPSNPSGECIYLGKFIQFGTSSDSSQIVVYPMVGGARNAVSLNTNVIATHPVAIAPSSTLGQFNKVDGTQSFQLEQGLTVAGDSGLTPSSYFYSATPPHVRHRTGAIGIMVGDNTSTIAVQDVGGYKSGSLQLTMYGVKNSFKDMPRQAMTDSLNTLVPMSLLLPASEASICIASGTTNQSGLISINAGLAVTLAIKTGLTC